MITPPAASIRSTTVADRAGHLAVEPGPAGGGQPGLVDEVLECDRDPGQRPDGAPAVRASSSDGGPAEDGVSVDQREGVERLARLRSPSRWARATSTALTRPPVDRLGQANGRRRREVHYQVTARCSGKIEIQGLPGGTVIGSPFSSKKLNGSSMLSRSQVPVFTCPW